MVLVQMSFYGFDNRYLLDVIQSEPETFAGIAVVQAEAPNLESEVAALARRGVRGFRIVSGNHPETWLDGPAMDRLWRAATAHEMAVCALADPPALPALERMCRRFPETLVVIDHMGRIGMAGPIAATAVDQLCRLAEARRVFVKVSAFYALGAKRQPYLDLAPLIRRLRDAFGAERLMWGSDSPFQVLGEHTYAASVELIGKLDFLSDAEREWLLGKTAEGIFFTTEAQVSRP